MNKKGINEMVVIPLMIILVVVLGFLIYKWMVGAVAEGGQKGGDRAIASDVCRDQVKVRVNKIEGSEGFFMVNLENLKKKTLSDFLVRYEKGKEVEIKRARQVLNGYENANIKVEKPTFNPEVIKVIPQIILEKPELKSMDKGWWLCSEQMAVYTL